MYTPNLSDDVIRALFRVKSATREPMTKVADALLREGLARVDKHTVCAACEKQGNTDCAHCILARSVPQKSA